MAGETTTPNIGLQVPAFNQGNWQVPTNYDWALIDSIFGPDGPQVPALNVAELTVAAFVGLTALIIINALGYTPLNPANNLSDVDNAAQARANLGISPVAGANVYAETPSGAVPGTTYTLSHTPSTVLGIYYNGLLLLPSQYSISSTTVTLSFSTQTGDSVFAVYLA